MKTHKIIINNIDWENSKHRTRKWEERVNIVRWEHDFIKKEYVIDIKIK